MRKLYILLSIFVFFTTGAGASKKIVVDLSRQIATAYQNGEKVFSGRISSGKAGHRTPTGSFRILEKDRYHRSNLYPAPNGGAKMYYMLRLTNHGIALHLGRVPNYPASHGCIRMRNGFAQKMYRWANVGTRVYVKGGSSSRSSRSSRHKSSKRSKRRSRHHRSSRKKRKYSPHKTRRHHKSRRHKRKKYTKRHRRRVTKTHRVITVPRQTSVPNRSALDALGSW